MLYLHCDEFTDLFDDNLKSIIYRQRVNGISNTLVDDMVGFVYKNGIVKHFKPTKSKTHVMYISNNTYYRICDIYNRGNDKRVNRLFEYILNYDNDFCDYRDSTIYSIQYSDDDLLKVW